MNRKNKASKRKRSLIAALFALSGLLCWCGISQVIGNSVSSAFENAFHIPPLWTTIVLTILAAVIVLRKHATVKVLDVMVPVMAGLYFAITLFIIIRNAGQLPAVFQRIFMEAFGFRQAVAGGIGAVIMNGTQSVTVWHAGFFPMKPEAALRPARLQRRISVILPKKGFCRLWASSSTPF